MERESPVAGHALHDGQQRQVGRILPTAIFVAEHPAIAGMSPCRPGKDQHCREVPPSRLASQHEKNTRHDFYREDHIGKPTGHSDGLKEPGSAGQRENQQFQDKAVRQEHDAERHAQEKGGKAGELCL